MSVGFLGNVQLPVTVGLASVASLGYLVSRARHGMKRFSPFDAVAMVLLMAIVTATSVPLLEAAADGARHTALTQNLQALRQQIALYTAHHGEPPALYEGSLPQLLQATNAAGIPVPADSTHCYGPYLRGIIPPNPFTGKSVVTATPTFPPATASGAGGWLYHQPTGKISADLPELLDR